MLYLLDRSRERNPSNQAEYHTDGYISEKEIMLCGCKSGVGINILVCLHRTTLYYTYHDVVMFTLNTVVVVTRITIDTGLYK